MFEKLKRIFLGEKPKEENNLNDIKEKIWRRIIETIWGKSNI